MNHSADLNLLWARLLLEELHKAPSVLRLSYLADVEDRKLVRQRVRALRSTIDETWLASDPDYELSIEQEVFWRTGKPPAEDRRLAGLEEGDQ